MKMAWCIPRPRSGLRSFHRHCEGLEVRGESPDERGLGFG